MPSKPDPAKDQPEPIDVAIVGGGIAGLYCAYKYGGNRKLHLFESTARLGGRIYTDEIGFELQQSSVTLLGNDRIQNDVKVSKDRFYAEYGPMRIEPEHQELLHGLLNELGIRPETDGVNAANGDHPRLVDFPAYASPLSEFEPEYILTGEEKDQETPLHLMKLGFIRILGKLEVASPTPLRANSKEEVKSLSNCVAAALDQLRTAVATRQQNWQAVLQRWIDDLDDEDYQNIRNYAAIEFKFGADSEPELIPLHQMGFWNLLSEVLSHSAVMKLRDIGTFYHLLPENPNGAEWLIFWLRALKTTEKLQGIDIGMRHIPERLRARLQEKKINIQERAMLVSIGRSTTGKIRLDFEITGEKEPCKKSYEANNVILAIPKAPLEKLVFANTKDFSATIRDQIDGVFGFSLVKIFVVVRRRWWEEDQRANVGATSIPTRELHYWKSKTPGSTRGMIMIYTDRPGSIFWTNYVGTRGQQTGPFTDRDTSIGGNPFKQLQMKRLKRKVVEVLKEVGAVGLDISDIEYCGIMDWGREPYGGASHAWRPERQVSEVLTSLSSFNLGDGASNDTGKIHICGEAYSDYQGFMEGALRSALHVLHRMDPRHRTRVDATAGKDKREVSTLTTRFCSCEECNPPVPAGPACTPT
jgi:monoamine oxidase